MTRKEEQVRKYFSIQGIIFFSHDILSDQTQMKLRKVQKFH